MTYNFRGDRSLRYEVTLEGLVTQRKINEDKTLLADALAEYNRTRTGT